MTPRRDALLLGFYAAAKGHEAKGLARLALAQYLAHKAKRSSTPGVSRAGPSAASSVEARSFARSI